jgi:hypothetical protein
MNFFARIVGAILGGCPKERRHSGLLTTSTFL